MELPAAMFEHVPARCVLLDLDETPLGPPAMSAFALLLGT
jgi:hypothetical protein